MSAPRSTPPDLSDFVFVRNIGGGGFADVFLYQQRRPNRQVAIKVLRSEHLSDEGLQQFETEADLMAQVSDHSYIVTIYAANIAPDGRPYIVMEYYSQPHFGLRARGGALPVAEVLRVGVQIACAVETAHQAGILHRDIKPANILTSAYGRPGLTDFGIAGVFTGDKVAAAQGVSLAYASPEVLTDEYLTGSVAADVYSLGATIYTLLAGRSPVWIPGGDNSDAALTQRAVAGALQPLGRDDLPPAFEHLLQQSMRSDPEQRPPGALGLARALQDVEQSLRLSPTPLEIPQAPPTPDSAPAAAARSSDEPDGTRRAGARIVDPDGPPEVAAEGSLVTGVPPAAAPSAAPTPPVEMLDEPATMLRHGGRRRTRPTPPTESPPEPTTPDSQPPVLVDRSLPQEDKPSGSTVARWAPWVGAAAVSILFGAFVIFATGSDGDSQPSAANQEDESAPVVTAIALAPPSPRNLTLTVDDGTATVSFDPPADDAEFEYRVMRYETGTGVTTLEWPDQDKAFTQSGDTTVTVDGFEPDEEVCVGVFSVDTQSGRLSSAPSAPRACARAGEEGG